LDPDGNGRLSVEKVAMLSSHEGEVLIRIFLSSFYPIIIPELR
jgi:hypothetical protein